MIQQRDVSCSTASQEFMHFTMANSASEGDDPERVHQSCSCFSCMFTSGGFSCLVLWLRICCSIRHSVALKDYNQNDKVSEISRSFILLSWIPAPYLLSDWSISLKWGCWLADRISSYLGQGGVKPIFVLDLQNSQKLKVMHPSPWELCKI